MEWIADIPHLFIIAFMLITIAALVAVIIETIRDLWRGSN